MTPLRLKDFPETTVYIQPPSLPAVPHDAGARAPATTNLADKVGQTLDDTFVHVRNAAETIQHALQTLVTTAQQVSVEVGFEVGADAGVVLASTNAGAHVRLVLTWVRTNRP
jgi:NTP-dependent ternary system trypsin peptidase co-occuring protein